MRTAVVSEDGERYTYQQLDERSTRLANHLGGRGMAFGDRILWIGQNSFRLLELLLAASKIGACVCVANWRNTAEEMRYVLQDFDPSLVFWQQEELQLTPVELQVAAPAAQWFQHDHERGATYAALLDASSAADDERQLPGDLPLLALYTAGFEGRPRAALLCSDNLLALSMTAMNLRQFHAEDRCLVTAPAFHVVAYQDVLATLFSGGMTVWLPRIDTARICELIERERCTRAFLFGLTKEQMVEHNRTARHDLKSLKSGPASDEWNQMVTIDRTGYNGGYPGVYGQTEISGPAIFEAIAPPSLGNAGRSAPLVAVRIWDESGSELPDGEVGEIVVRGPLVMLGYHDDEPGTKRMQAEGWRRTNDLGRREADGSISFVGPKGRMLKSGVENIYPIEVEQGIRSHPAIRDSAVIGVPDERWVQSVMAIVCLEADASLTAGDLIAYCRQRLAGYKVPRSVVFAEELPRKDGSIDYESLDAEHGGGNYPGLSSQMNWDGRNSERGRPST
jgi:long-chain acyl-CoA synthetase